MPSSPAGSLFASDYSLSAPPSPATPSPRLTPSPHPTPNSRPGSSPRLSPIPTHLRPKPLDISFTSEPTTNTLLPTLTTSSDGDSPPAISPLPSPLTPLTDDERKNGSLVSPTTIKAGANAMEREWEAQKMEEARRASKVSMESKAKSGKSGKSRRGSAVYGDFETCMEGGMGHETKSQSYPPGSEKAQHHLLRSLALFTSALNFKPTNPRCLLAKSKILLTLSGTYQPPRVALASLRTAVTHLRKLVDLVPASVSARETLAQGLGCLSQMLQDVDDTYAVIREGNSTDEVIWEGEVGEFAREALGLLEDVAGDKMDKMRGMRPEVAAGGSPEMAETFLDLAAAALRVSTLSNDLSIVDSHIELTEQALDQASNMATVAATSKLRSTSSSTNLITRIQLASGRSSLERLRHTFLLGVELDEDDLKSLMSDMDMLATECRERAARLKGSKAAVAGRLAWEAVKQLGDGKLVWASILRMIWRKRKPRTRGASVGSTDLLSPGTARKGSSGAGALALGLRKISMRSDSLTVGDTIKEEDEDEEGSFRGLPVLAKNENRRGSIQSRKSLGAMGSDSRKSSGLSSIPDDTPMKVLDTNRRTSFTTPSTRRGSWLPENTVPNRTRRMSSMSTSLTLPGPDGIFAWNRKASTIALPTDEVLDGHQIPSAQLAQTAYTLLESSTKQYKLALSLLSNSDFPPTQLARARADTLIQIAYVNLFQASLAPRLSIAMEKRTSSLVTCEVYSTWAAREVGWSFLIEGTAASAAADRRTNSWKADESGKRAVMLLVRTWWWRAVTTETVDVDTKMNAKDAVEVVVRRMKDREGVKDGDAKRFGRWVAGMEGEVDQAEALFWRSVGRILRGGNGFVMS